MDFLLLFLFYLLFSRQLFGEFAGSRLRRAAGWAVPNSALSVCPNCFWRLSGRSLVWNHLPSLVRVSLAVNPNLLCCSISSWLLLFFLHRHGEQATSAVLLPSFMAFKPLLSLFLPSLGCCSLNKPAHAVFKLEVEFPWQVAASLTAWVQLATRHLPLISKSHVPWVPSSSLTSLTEELGLLAV